jgi:hypothetical protein
LAPVRVVAKQGGPKALQSQDEIVYRGNTRLAQAMIVYERVIGVIGAFMGGWLFGALGISAGGLIGSLVTATIGAISPAVPDPTDQESVESSSPTAFNPLGSAVVFRLSAAVGTES